MGTVGQAIYGSYGNVTVIEQDGNFTKIDTGNQEFWVRTEKLKWPRPEKIKPTRAMLPVVSSTVDAWTRFVSYLEATGYQLGVHTKADTLEIVEIEYLEWSGELIPYSAVSIYENRPTGREWRLLFTLQDGMEVPFPVEIMGQTGQHPTKNPRGLWDSTGKVHVYFATIIEKLVRAGLRIPASA